jgi:hypothetical protein
LKIISVVFDYYHQEKYKKLSEVFSYSIKKNCPGSELELLKINPPKIHKNKSKSFASNTVKLELWLERLKATDQDVIFLDCDMLVLKDLSSAFNLNFDIGYTKRTRARIPYNGGVVFVKNTPEAVSFIELWAKINKKMYDNSRFHSVWRAKYAGMNQSAFGYILEKEKYNAILKQFPCEIWNACNEDWSNIGDKTKIIHIKGGLRRSVLHQAPGFTCKWQRAYTLWRKYAIECGLIKKPVRQNSVKPVQKKHSHIVRLKGLRRRRRRVL